MLSSLIAKVNSPEEFIDMLRTFHEKHIMEYKEATNLPKSFWETYSSFCNTTGGIVVLGVKEALPENKIIGVGNAEKIITDLWNQLSNRNKVNYRNIGNEDVIPIPVDSGRTIIVIVIREAPDSMKPIYLDGREQNAFMRTGDGDRNATAEELQAMLRNAQPAQDSIALEHYTLDDLDTVSVVEYKTLVHKRYPAKKYASMTDEDFLVEIGACLKDRVSQKVKVKRGTLLFLGKVNAIKEEYPRFHLDYYNMRGDNPRWSDRVSDDEPSDTEMNIFQFFRLVDMKLKAVIQESFQLDSQQIRLPIGDFDETIRECLANCLAHADYIQGYPSVKIEAYDGWYRFLNPGKMLVSPEQFRIGGDSRPRNEIIMKLFRLIGVSDRQGGGGPLIFKSALERQYRMPEIETTIEKTELKVWRIDLVDSYSDLTAEEKRCLRFVIKSAEAVSVKQVCTDTGYSDYRVRKAFAELVKRGLLEIHGSGPSTRYAVAADSPEMLTQLQMTVESLKKHLFEK